jgi:hypothetical protein
MTHGRLAAVLVSTALLVAPAVGRAQIGLGMGCPIVPFSGCRQTTRPGPAKLLVKHSPVNPFSDKFAWKWRRGAATDVADFATPTDASGATYAFCVYDHQASSPTLFLGYVIQAAKPCVHGPCWAATSDGFHFEDAVGTIDLHAGASGAAEITIAGHGVNLGLMTAHFHKEPAVLLQLSNTAGFCWESRFSTASRNSQQVFRARGD